MHSQGVSKINWKGRQRCPWQPQLRSTSGRQKAFGNTPICWECASLRGQEQPRCTSGLQCPLHRMIMSLFDTGPAASPAKALDTSYRSITAHNFQAHFTPRQQPHRLSVPPQSILTNTTAQSNPNPLWWPGCLTESTLWWEYQAGCVQHFHQADLVDSHSRNIDVKIV